MSCLYLFGMVMGINCGAGAENDSLQGKPIPFIMELPNYRLPLKKALSLHMWEKAKDFLQRGLYGYLWAEYHLVLQSFDA